MSIFSVEEDRYEADSKSKSAKYDEEVDEDYNENGANRSSGSQIIGPSDPRRVPLPPRPPRQPPKAYVGTAPDGSPILKPHGTTLGEASTILLTEVQQPEVGCGCVPQRVASEGSVTFFLNLHKFPEGVLFGDLVCDCYEPWNGQCTEVQYFARVGDDYQRTCLKVSLLVCPYWAGQSFSLHNSNKIMRLRFQMELD